MKTINLRDYYPYLYTSDCFIEVPDEVEGVFTAFKIARRPTRAANITTKPIFPSTETMA